MPSAVKGSEREVFVRDFLEQLFPRQFRFGSGAITDQEGACSGQLDIVVEYPFLPSFPMPGGSERLYLSESVALALEVKSDVSSQWSQVEKALGLLRPIRRRWKGETTLGARGITFGQPSETPVPYIAVGYTGYASLATLDAKLAATPAEKRPDGVLVIDSGVFVGPGCRADGVFGLYGLAIVITNLLRAVSAADGDIGAYVAAHVE